MPERTTLTLDSDVAHRLREEMHARGSTFKATVNAVLRLGLEAAASSKASRPFKVRPRALGARPGVDFTKVSELLEQVEGPRHR